MQKRIVIGVLALAFTASAAGTAVAGQPAAPGQNKLQCFDGTTDTANGVTGGYTYGGTCTQPTSGAKGSAVLTMTDAAPDGDYAGVYINDTTLSGAPLGQVTQLTYKYVGTKVPTPTELSLNVPIDTNNNGTADGYAYVDAAYCPGVNGLVDVVNDPNCGFYWLGTVFYPNWAAFVTTNPGYKVGTDYLPFIVAERTPTDAAQTWTVSNVTLGKGGALPGKKK
jgi:hypothetical protein